jgi:DNA-binding MarR family transcriptional regulator
LKEECGNTNPNIHGKIIQRLSKRIKYLADDNLAKHNITLEQVKVIAYLDRHKKDKVYQKDIESEFLIKRSSVTNILQNMEKRGIVRREDDILDARMKRVLLTEKGTELSKLLKGYMDSLESVIVKDMTDQDKEIFLTLLKKALNNVEEFM